MTSSGRTLPSGAGNRFRCRLSSSLGADANPRPRLTAGYKWLRIRKTPSALGSSAGMHWSVHASQGRNGWRCGYLSGREDPPARSSESVRSTPGWTSASAAPCTNELSAATHEPAAGGQGGPDFIFGMIAKPTLLDHGGLGRGSSHVKGNHVAQSHLACGGCGCQHSRRGSRLQNKNGTCSGVVFRRQATCRLQTSSGASISISRNISVAHSDSHASPGIHRH